MLSVKKPIKQQIIRFTKKPNDLHLSDRTGSFKLQQQNSKKLFIQLQSPLNEVGKLCLINFSFQNSHSDIYSEAWEQYAIWNNKHIGLNGTLKFTNGAFPLHGTARYGTVRFTFGGFSTGYCT